MPTILRREESPEEMEKQTSTKSGTTTVNDYTNDKDIQEVQAKAAEAVVLSKPVINEPIPLQQTQAPMETPTSASDAEIIEAYNKEDAVKRFNAIKSEYSSYTEYYNKTKSHIPGMERQGAALLKEERIKREYKEVESGYRTEEDFLMKNYGYDILADAGHDVRSTGYWYNKIMNNDTSNPLSNQYTISKVLTLAPAAISNRTIVS